MLASAGSGCRHRLTSAERSDCTETIINQLLTDSYRNPTDEWQVTSGLHLVAGLQPASTCGPPTVSLPTSVCASLPHCTLSHSQARKLTLANMSSNKRPWRKGRRTQ